MVDSVTILLGQRPELVIDFNMFLPPGFAIKWQAVAGVHHFFLTSPDGLEVIVPTGPGALLQGFGNSSLAVMDDSHGEDAAMLEDDPEAQKKRATARARVKKGEMILLTSPVDTVS